MSLRPVVRLIAAALAALAPAALQAQGSAPATAAEPLLAIVGANVVPMDRERVLEDWTVIVRGGRIAEMGPRADVAVPAGATVIDAAGRWLMPGLADMHIHATNGTGQPGDPAWQQMTLLLANGVTTARSLSGAPTAFQLRERIRAGEVAGPTLYLAGGSLNFQSVPTPEAARAAVAAQAAAGADVLKTHGVSLPVYEAIVEAADAHDLPLAGHVTPDYGLARALEAGQQIEHLDGYLAALVPEADRHLVPAGQFYFGDELARMDEARIPELARRTVEAGVANGPTLALFELVGAGAGPEAYQGMAELAYVPAQARTNWANQLAGIVQTPVEPGRRERYLELRRAMTRALQGAGALLLAGSDSPQLFMVSGFALHHEIRALQAAGLTPYEALSAATRAPAESLGADFGVIAEGRPADLVLVGANPLEDVAAAARIEGVALRGRWLPRAELDAMLAAVREAVGG